MKSTRAPLISYVKRILRGVVLRLPLLRDMYRTSGTAAPITWRGWLIQKVLGFNRNAYWPMHPTSVVSDATLVRTGIGTAPGLSRGCYIQSRNGIEIGDYTLVAPNVGLISSNHDPYTTHKLIPSDPIRIGCYCWIGMNAVILPGVVLGNHTVVGAGAVVTHSFPDGYCVLGGSPARRIKTLDPTQIAEHRNRYEYIGFHYVGTQTKQEIFQERGVREL